MSRKIHSIVGDWTRQYNRRRLAESLLLGIAALFGAGALLLIVQILASSPFPWVPLLIPAVTIPLVSAAGRYLDRSRTPRQLARLIDRSAKTHDLFSTALAVEADLHEGDPSIARLVLANAELKAPDIDANSVEPFLWPKQTLGVMVLLLLIFAAVSDLHDQQDAEKLRQSRLQTNAAVEKPAPVPEEDPKEKSLTEETLQEIAEQREALEMLAQTPGLSPETSKAIGDIVKQLRNIEAGKGNPHAMMQALAQSERSLRELAQSMQRETNTLDPKALKEMSDDRLTESLQQALQQGNYRTAQTLTKELKKRTHKNDDDANRRLGAALQLAMGQIFPQTPAEKAVQDQLSKAASDMLKGNKKDAVKALQQAQKQLRKMSRQASPKNRALSNAMSKLQSARREQLAMMNGTSRQMARQMARQRGMAKRKGRGKGTGKGRGKGAGKGRGKGAGKGRGKGAGKGRGRGRGRGRGMGRGRRGLGKGFFGGGKGGVSAGPGGGPPLGASGPLLDGPPLPAEWIESQWEETEGMLRIIEGGAKGERSTSQYSDVHESYNKVAEEVIESATQRESIPLTRREYIREYFEAIRPE